MIFRCFPVDDYACKAEDQHLLMTPVERAITTDQRSTRQLQEPTVPERKFEDNEDLTQYRRVRIRIMQAKTSHLKWRKHKYRATLLRITSDNCENLGTGYVSAVSFNKASSNPKLNEANAL